MRQTGVWAPDHYMNPPPPTMPFWRSDQCIVNYFRRVLLLADVRTILLAPRLVCQNTQFANSRCMPKDWDTSISLPTPVWGNAGLLMQNHGRKMLSIRTIFRVEMYRLACPAICCTFITTSGVGISTSGSTTDNWHLKWNAYCNISLVALFMAYRHRWWVFFARLCSLRVKNGGQGYFWFHFWPSFSTSRTWFPHKKRTSRRLSASISELKTQTHTRLLALFSGLPRCAGTRKVKPICILLKQETVSDSGVSWAICKSATHSRQITVPVFTGWMPLLPPNQQSQSTEGSELKRFIISAFWLSEFHRASMHSLNWTISQVYCGVILKQNQMFQRNFALLQYYALSPKNKTPHYCP